MAVTTFNHAFMYSDGGWAKSRRLDPDGRTFTGVSCPTSTFCTAVNDSDNAVTYHG